MIGIFRNFSKSHREARRSGDAILSAVLAQARCPVFYERGGVADTVIGRFDMIAVHAFVTLRALRHAGTSKDISQAFTDALFARIDSSFREMGVSDPGVPRKMRQAAEAFYGRLGAYEKGLNDGGFAGLEAALVRNLYGGDEAGSAELSAMARYVIGCLGTLALASPDDWKKGAIRFAEPELGAIHE